jgi:hypothetical protein
VIESHENSATAHYNQAEANRRRALASRLGLRARMRRIELRLSRPAVVQQLSGTSSSNLQHWERRLPLDGLPIEEEWERALNVPRGWLRSQFMHPVPVGFEPERALEPRAEPAGVTLAATGAVPDEIMRLCLLGSGGDAIVAEAMGCLYGLHGAVHRTPEAVSRRFALAPSQVDSVQWKFRRNLSVLSPATPALDALRSEIDARLPAHISTLDEELRDILGPNLSVVDVDFFCQSTLRRALINTTAGDLGCLVLPQGLQYDDLRRLRSAAAAVIGWTGAANVNLLAGMHTAQDGANPPSTESIAAWCMALPRFEWIDRDSGWFWLGAEAPSRVHTIVRKLLSVAADRLDVQDVQSAVASARQEASSAADTAMAHDLPAEILEELLSRYPEVRRIQRQHAIRARTPIDRVLVLDPQELALLRVLEGSSGLGTRLSITHELCTLLGVPRAEASRILDTSPIVAEISDGVFRLRGRFLDPRGYQRVTAQRSQEHAAMSGLNVFDSAAVDARGTQAPAQTSAAR